MTDKSKPSEADIRKRAHEIWEREGRPHFRDQEHWHKAEAELAAAGPQGNEGEGSKTAALAFDRSQDLAHRALPVDQVEDRPRQRRQRHRYAQPVEHERQGAVGPDVAGKAKAARKALDGPEGADLRKAEAAGRVRSRGEDPELNRKSGKGPTKRA